MLNWNIINTKGIVIRLRNEKETTDFLNECEKKNIKWKSGLKATESSKCYREISTNEGNFLTEEHNGVLLDFKNIIMLSIDKVSVIWMYEDNTVDILEVVKTDDIKYLLDRQKYFSKIYNKVEITGGVDFIKK